MSGERYTWIVVVDIVGSASFSDVLPLDTYAKYLLGDFHRLAMVVLTKVMKGDPGAQISAKDPDQCHLSARGDEVIAMFAPTTPAKATTLEEKQRCAWRAMRFACLIKARWLLSRFNKKERFDRQKPLVDLAVGIHCADLFWFDHSHSTTINKPARSPEGYGITVAKRIEGESRSFEQVIFAVSSAAKYELVKATPSADGLFSSNKVSGVKGLSGIRRVYEFGRELPELDKLLSGESTLASSRWKAIFDFSPLLTIKAERDHAFLAYECFPAMKSVWAEATNEDLRAAVQDSPVAVEQAGEAIDSVVATVLGDLSRLDRGARSTSVLAQVIKLDQQGHHSTAHALLEKSISLLPIEDREAAQALTDMLSFVWISPHTPRIDHRTAIKGFEFIMKVGTQAYEVARLARVVSGRLGSDDELVSFLRKFAGRGDAARVLCVALAAKLEGNVREEDRHDFDVIYRGYMSWPSSYAKDWDDSGRCLPHVWLGYAFAASVLSEDKEKQKNVAEYARQAIVDTTIKWPKEHRPPNLRCEPAWDTGELKVLSQLFVQ